MRATWRSARLADPGDRRAAGARARQRAALCLAARQPAAHLLHRRRARAVRLRRPGPHRRVLPLRRPDRRRGNINLVSIGDYEHPKARFPGSFGSAYLYYVVPKVILFRLEHTRRTLVEKVDFISAPGASPDNVYRPGGPIALITNRCLFAFDRGARRFRLASVHPGHTLAEVDRAYRLRLRPARGRAGDARALPRDAAPAAHGGRAAAGGGLSAVRRRGVRGATKRMTPGRNSPVSSPAQADEPAQPSPGGVARRCHIG